ncbi:hypothetical protein LTR91_008527 [Friedmanniomyces endolithicus]|uniref:F-box domain-containing protein n=1 Tax=Friedmanniomyces endolithicus TaxID=329885 RepID=A0AAN6FQZ0_9PEZI|nr:hypothetical protein LTR35_003541 [Friedmanniomyces endolithicus]KAK0294021.1 hypothetical protein LTS00_007360 [Friedmanniomyces endolithicus]KAK0312088.1 hypothetical protein LTR01_003002 [Friedmanniomyces endolithicus]KAK0321704.1 hypothetical protein LTR82_007190 [Friedmanniomyces endolithicus]KAK0832321.1 hypothetical protein LTR73_002608 [Friedmanniomyces endolithicus]
MAFAYLPTASDIHNIRLVSRNFREAAWPAFGRTFNNKVFHLTYQGVTALCMVALCARVVPYITHLYISTLQPHTQSLEPLIAWCAMSCNEQERTSRYLALDGYKTLLLEETRDLAATRDFLAAALDNLAFVENLTIVGGEHVYTSPPRSSSRALRSDTYLQKPMRSPRWHKLPDRTNDVLREAEHVVTRLYDHNAYAHTLRLLFDGLATSGDTTSNRIRRFRIFGAVHFEELAISVTRDLDSPPSSDARNMLLELNGLTHLDMQLEVLNRGSNGLLEATINRLNLPLPGFLARMRNITSLRLSFPPDVYDMDDNLTVAAYLGASSDLYGLAIRPTVVPTSLLALPRLPAHRQPLHFPHLKELYLANLILDTSRRLRVFLASHAATLRTLRLQAVQVVSRDDSEWIALLYSLHSPHMHLEVFQILPFIDAAHQFRLENDPRTVWVDLDGDALRGCASKQAQILGWEEGEMKEDEG